MAEIRIVTQEQLLDELKEIRTHMNSCCAVGSGSCYWADRIDEILFLLGEDNDAPRGS